MDWARYQVRVAGPTEYRVLVKPETWADGIRDADCSLLDAKHVGDPAEKSPYVDPNTF